MVGTIEIQGKVLGKKKPLFEGWSIALPPVDDGGGGESGDGDYSLRRLIAAIVCEEVAAFRKRQEKRRLEMVLSKEQIEVGIAKGKVDSGGRDLQQEVDVEEAIGVAWQAFEDGIYLVVIDGTSYRSLDEAVFVREGSRVTFVKLVMLAGA
ncbi:hypothetical protein [Lacunimicrobium album]